MSGIVWSAIAIAMYALLRALGSVGGPFDVVGEFSSIIAALLRGIGAVIEGAGLSGLAVVIPGPPGQEGLIFWVAALLRLTEIVALFAMAVAAVRTLSATHRVFARGKTYRERSSSLCWAFVGAPNALFEKRAAVSS